MNITKNVLGFMLIVISLSNIVSADSVTFIEPTPVNNDIIQINNVTINTSLQTDNLTTMIWSWNGINTTFLNDSCVLHLSFNNNTAIGENSSHVVDVSQYGNNGSFINGTTGNWTVDGKWNGAMSFDGDDDHINISLLTIPAVLDNFGMIVRDDYNPVISAGGAGDWDKYIREIGNIIYDIADANITQRYKTFYTGHNTSPYEGNKTYIGYAYSSDGVNWTKFGKIIDRPLEDPYVVINNSTYYLYAEDKEDVPFRNIRRYHSSDCKNWIDDGDVFDPQNGGTPNDWEATDVSSPVVWIEDNIWYLLYEGRGGGYDGKIGLANSTNGTYWIRNTNIPIFDTGTAGEWDDTNVVSDDIVKVNDTYYLFYHGYNGSSGWQCGMASSTTLHNWVRDNRNPIKDAATVMIGYDGDYFIFVGVTGIVRYGLYLSPLNITDAITITTWVKMPAMSSNRGIISKKTQAEWGENVGYAFLESSGSLLLRIGNKETTSVQRVDDNLWHHCAVLWSSGNPSTIYIDGIEITNYVKRETSPKINTSSTQLQVGLYHEDRNFNGTIDELRIYNRVLTSNEINKSYHANLWKHNISHWYFTVNETSLNNGTHNYQVFINNIASVWRTVIIGAVIEDIINPMFLRLKSDMIDSTESSYALAGIIPIIIIFLGIMVMMFGLITGIVSISHAPIIIGWVIITLTILIIGLPILNGILGVI